MLNSKPTEKLKVVLIIFAVIASPHKLLFSQQNNDANTALRRGCMYLMSQQQKDGSWKSEYYGNLKQGAAITAMVLFSLSHVDQSLVKEKKHEIKRSFDFLKKGIDKHGYVANLSGPDYSNYATALTLLAAKNFETNFDWRFLSKEDRASLVRFLINSQLDETHGLKPDADDYGGWDLSGWMQAPRSSPGTNVSITSFALLALNDVKDQQVEVCRRKALRWIDRIQNSDGGLHFHPKKDHAGNKAEWTDENSKHPKSYGTATVDGIRVYRSLNSRQAKIRGCVGWLENHLDERQPVFVPGFDVGSASDSSWGKGLLYYFFMSLALENKHLSKKLRASYQSVAIQFLVKQQKENGSWENSSARMREDDPLIATPFAVIALSQFRQD